MKKFFLVGTILSLLLLLQGLSLGATVGPYMSGQLGLAFLSDNEISKEFKIGEIADEIAGEWADQIVGELAGETVGEIKGDMEFDPGFEFSVAGGYDFGMFRVEGEVGYQANDIDKVSGCYQGTFGRVCVSDVSSSGNVTILSFLTNGYLDFVNKTPFTPYLTAGIGVAKIDINDLAVSIFPIGDSDDTVFLYQLGAGVAYAINKNFAIDLKYRYIVMEEPEFEGMDTKVTVHHVYLGFRYNF